MCATDLIVSVVIGVATGAFSSYYVSRKFYRLALLDECIRLIKRLCPYRKENVRGGDGLDETSWALKIQSEMLARNRFAKESETIETISRSIGGKSDLPNHNDGEATKTRDDEKAKWHEAIGELY